MRWPAQGSRPVDPDTGDEGGTTEGTFISEWKGDILFGRNDAVGGHYILAYGEDPERADPGHERDPRRILLWHANYHPDGGQLFFPLDGKPFLVPLALPGDDVAPADFVCFRFDGSRGLYIHPNIWHEGVFADRAARSDSSTSRARCTRAFRSILRASSAACSRRRSSRARRGYERVCVRRLLRRVVLAPGAAPARRSSSPRDCARAPLETSPSAAPRSSRAGARAAPVRFERLAHRANVLGRPCRSSRR